MLESILSDIDNSYYDYPPDNYGMFSASLFSRFKMQGRDVQPFVSLGIGFYAVDGSGFMNYGNLEDWRDRNSGELIAQSVRYAKGFFSFGLGAVLPIDETGDILLEARMWNSFDLTERFFPLSLSFRFKL